MFPDRKEITGKSYEVQLEETSHLLATNSVTIFEGAIRHKRLFARVAILRKTRDRIDLIEVKAKSFNSEDPSEFRNKDGSIGRKFKPYLQDVAFQTFVVRQAYPEFEVHSHLMLADKAKKASVDGLNQLFKIQSTANGPRVIVGTSVTRELIGSPILECVNVDDLVDEILRVPLEAPGAAGKFEDLALTWSEVYREDIWIAPTIGAHCDHCQFRSNKSNTSLRSGLHECWQHAAKLTPAGIDQDWVLDLHNFHGKDKLIQAGVYKLSQVPFESFKNHEVRRGLTRAHRWAMQISGKWPGRTEFFLEENRLKDAMSSWTYPLHFIDFETARPAIPLSAGQHPYDNVAFQFSHHTVDANGEVAQRGQFLCTTPGQ